MTNEAITVDKDILAKRAAEAAQQAADEARKTVTAPLETAQSWGIGGSFLTTLIAGITSFFSRIGSWVSSLFGGSSTPPAQTPAAPPTTDTPPPAADTPAVAPPAKTPAVAAAPAGAARGTGR